MNPPIKSIWAEAPSLVQRMIAKGLMSVIPQPPLDRTAVLALKLGLTVEQTNARALKMRRDRERKQKKGIK